MLADLKKTLPREARYEQPVMAIIKAIHSEIAYLRQQNDAPEPIQDTTLRRGEIRALKRILAQLEVGPESRLSEDEESPSQHLPMVMGDEPFGA